MISTDQVFVIVLTKRGGKGQKDLSEIYLKVIRDKIAADMEARIINQNKSLKEILVLLKRNKLPYNDLKLNGNLFISYHDADGKVIGAGGLEFHHSYALLRSVAVDEGQRGKEFGKEIVKDLLDRAKNKSIKEIYLLTETAHGFFLKRGFVDVARENVPTEIKASSEFASVCPVSAACMVYRF